jgi:hypothetical protein
MLMAPESPLAAEILAEETEGNEGYFYTRSTGERVPLVDMKTPHLKSAHAKLAREFPGHPEIAPMADEIAKRDAEYQAQQAEAGQ